MATTVTISDAAKGFAEELVKKGCYESLDQAVEAGLWRLQDDEDHDDLTEEEWASVEAALAEVDAGKGIPAEQVFVELRERFKAIARGALADCISEGAIGSEVHLRVDRTR